MSGTPSASLLLTYRLKAVPAAQSKIRDGRTDQKNPACVRAENKVRKSEIDTCRFGIKGQSMTNQQSSELLAPTCSIMTISFNLQSIQCNKLDGTFRLSCCVWCSIGCMAGCLEFSVSSTIHTGGSAVGLGYVDQRYKMDWCWENVGPPMLVRVLKRRA